MNGTNDRYDEGTTPAMRAEGYTPPPGGAADPPRSGGASPASSVPPGGSPYTPGIGAGVNAALQTHGADPRAKSPALACFLSAMPGLGQIYVGYYQRGFVHTLVVGSLIALLATGDLDELTPLAGLFLAFFWLYNIIDAARRATSYNQALAGAETIEMPRDFAGPGLGGSVFGGVLLIGVGTLLLAHTKLGVSLDWLIDWWPVAPILLGVFLLVRAVQERNAGGA